MPLTMRGRYLMREYWTDSDLFLKLSPEEREFYVGLWMLADDDGWMPRDVPEIAGHLLRFEDRGPREAKTRTVLRRLTAIGKVSSLRCGCLFLQAVAKYPRAGRKSVEHHQHHQKHSNGFDDSGENSKDIQSDLKPSPVVLLPDEVRRSAREGVNEKKNGLTRFPPFESVVKGIQ